MIEIAPVTSNWLTYSQATMYCFFYAKDNRKNWRVPTYDEYLNNDGIVAQAMHEVDWIIDSDIKLIVQPVRTKDPDEY